MTRTPRIPVRIGEVKVGASGEVLFALGLVMLVTPGQGVLPGASALFGTWKISPVSVLVSSIRVIEPGVKV